MIITIKEAPLRINSNRLSIFDQHRMRWPLLFLFSLFNQRRVWLIRRRWSILLINHLVDSIWIEFGDTCDGFIDLILSLIHSLRLRWSLLVIYSLLLADPLIANICAHSYSWQVATLIAVQCLEGRAERTWWCLVHLYCGGLGLLFICICIFWRLHISVWIIEGDGGIFRVHRREIAMWHDVFCGVESHFHLIVLIQFNLATWNIR